MKVLTLHQPWASLVALGVKTIETRSWSTQYRGPLAIHAAAKVVYGLVGDYRAETWFSDVQHIPDRCVHTALRREPNSRLFTGFATSSSRIRRTAVVH